MPGTNEKTAPERKYTEAQEKRIQEIADNSPGGVITGDIAQTIADEMGKDVRSVRAKASRMGIYKAKEKQSTNGGDVENKEEIAAEITAIVGRNLDSLSKAQKPQLQLLRDFLRAATSEPEAIAA